jgi:hypothetical protein
VILTPNEFDNRSRADQECWALAKADPCNVRLHECIALLQTRGNLSNPKAYATEQLVLRELQQAAMVLGRVTYDRFAHQSTQAEQEEVPA